MIVPQDGTILDFGCGRAYWLKIARKGAPVRRSDLAEPCGKQSLRYTPKAGSNGVNPSQPDADVVPTDANLVHHPSLMNAGEGCRAGASQSDAKAGPSCL
jgi:hypothetical protein